MSFRIPTLITAGLFGAFLVVGSMGPAFAGDGSCGKDKNKGATTTSTLWSPASAVSGRPAS